MAKFLQVMAFFLVLVSTACAQNSILYDIDMRGNKIVNLDEGTSPTDAVNKGQLDAATSPSVFGVFVPVAGANVTTSDTVFSTGTERTINSASVASTTPTLQQVTDQGNSTTGSISANEIFITEGIEANSVNTNEAEFTTLTFSEGGTVDAVVTSVDSNSLDTELPTAKAVYDALPPTPGLSSVTAYDASTTENLTFGGTVLFNVFSGGGTITVGVGSAPQGGFVFDLDQGGLDIRSDELPINADDCELTVATIDTGQGATEVYAMNQDVESTDDVTFATVDTGQGANELYAMDQDLESTDDVTFADLTADSVISEDTTWIYQAGRDYKDWGIFSGTITENTPYAWTGTSGSWSTGPTNDGAVHSLLVGYIIPPMIPGTVISRIELNTTLDSQTSFNRASLYKYTKAGIATTIWEQMHPPYIPSGDNSLVYDITDTTIEEGYTYLIGFRLQHYAVTTNSDIVIRSVGYETNKRIY